jgi:DNA polymerase III subunit alpha
LLHGVRVMSVRGAMVVGMTITRRTAIGTLAFGAAAAWFGVHRRRDDPMRSRPLRARAEAGLRGRLDGLAVDDRPYRARLRHELETIEASGLEHAFLAATTVVAAARSAGAAVGTARGPTPGSLVCWALGVTAVDPLRHQLHFERFLNVRRRSPPRLDIDVDAEQRDAVLETAWRQLGRQVAFVESDDDIEQVLLRSAADDVPVPRDLVARVLAQVPLVRRGRHDRLDAILERIPELTEAAERLPAVRSWRQLALEQARFPTRWCGPGADPDGTIAVTPGPLPVDLPLERDDAGRPWLTLTRAIAERTGAVELTCNAVPGLGAVMDAPDVTEDPALFRALRGMDLDGLFQLEDDTLRAYIRELDPQCFEHLVAALALARPFQIRRGRSAAYAAARRGATPPSTGVAIADRVLAPTYGQLVYDEQVIELAHLVSGLDRSEGDLLRRALNKWQADPARFVEGAVRRGVARRRANALFARLREETVGTVTRSHVVAEAALVARSAWLRLNRGPTAPSRRVDGRS